MDHRAILPPPDEPHLIGSEKLLSVLHRHYRGVRWPQVAEAARLREGNACAVCGRKVSSGLVVDHIVPWRICHCNEEWNLMGLCASCHPIKTNKAEPKLVVGDLLGFLEVLRISGWPMERVNIAVKNWNENPQLPLAYPQAKDPKPCLYEGCKNNALARGLCVTHYSRWRIHGTTHVDKRKEASDRARQRGCSYEGCGRKHYGRGLCRMHHQRQWFRSKSETYGKTPF